MCLAAWCAGPSSGGAEDVQGLQAGATHLSPAAQLSAGGGAVQRHHNRLGTDAQVANQHVCRGHREYHVPDLSERMSRTGLKPLHAGPLVRVLPRLPSES